MMHYYQFNIGEAYPRIRGGNHWRCQSTIRVLGLSPHTRGKPGSLVPGTVTLGPIPAYAGETDSQRLSVC